MHHLTPGQTKVNYIIESFVRKNIGRFQIPVNYIELLQIFESLSDLPEHVQYLSLFNLLIFLVTLDKIPYIAGSAVLDDDVKIAIVLSNMPYT
jgi:uncharacterized protein YpmS